MAASYTRRRLGGRHPSCGIGVTSRIAVISSPTAWSERMAASRPAPGPRTKTSTCLSPYSIALRAATSAAICAAKGVLLREPRKPALPALDQATTLPIRSVRVTIVLLKVAWMCAMPVRTSRRSRFLPPFFRGVGFCSSAMSHAPAFFRAVSPPLPPHLTPPPPPPPLSPRFFWGGGFRRPHPPALPKRRAGSPGPPPGGGVRGGARGAPLRHYPCRALCRGFLQMMRVTP